MGGTDPFGWIGAVVEGRFAVEAIAGEGAFGIVYRGRHLGLAEPIAIKCLKIPASMTAEEQERFLASFREEARLLHRLSRRTAAIVQALDVGAAESPRGVWTPYIVMEWLDGETLQDDLDRRARSGARPRGLREAVALLAPAADALAIAHAEGISHRDVKPGNLFLARAGTETTVKVVDFGIAKVLADAPSLTQALVQTGSSIRALTPMYGAPEQFDARFGATGPWTDVFALALILVELASGKPALSGGNAFELFGAAIADDRPSLSARGVPVPPAVEQVLRRALEVDPVRRFKHVGHLWAALSGALNSGEAMVAEVAADSGGTDATQIAATTRDRAAAPTTARAGEPVPEPTVRDTEVPAPSGENRVCTVLLADTSGYAALGDRLDPEAHAALIDECSEVLQREIEALGGTVYKALGDSVMAVFGAPKATDNDAERAIASALAAQTALGRISHRALRRHRPPVTIVIHTGRVFAGRLGGTVRKDFTVIGEAVSLAGRMLQLAPQGAIVIGKETHRHVAGLFEVEPLGAGEPPDPTATTRTTSSMAIASAFRVRGRAPAGRTIPPTDFLGLETKLVGRAAETSRLTDLFDAVAADPLSETVVSEQRAQLVTVVGPPGVGRSRLLTELGRSLDQDAFVVMGQCSPLSESTSYALAGAVLRAAFHLAEDDPPAEVERKLRRGIRVVVDVAAAEGGAAAPDGLDDVAAVIASMVGAHASARVGSIEALVPDEEKSFSKHRIAAAFARLIGFAAERRPVAILCDDAQWADDASLDLLDDMVVRLGRARLLVALAARPLLYERRPHWGEGKTSHVRLDVGPLSRRHIEEVVRDRLRKVRDLSSQVVRTLVERAEGSPLTLVETLHLLVDAGVIDSRDPEAWIVHEESLTALALPATVQGIVQARLDRLAPEERVIIGQAAVVGRTFWEGAIDWMRRAGSQAEGSAHEILGRLRDKQLIRVREASAYPDQREYVFAESATQEVAYAALAARVRQPLHRQVAGWLERVAPGDGGAALVAKHWDRGGDVAKAFVAYTRAAGHAAALGQNAEAKGLLLRAREIHDETAAGTAEHPVADPSSVTPLDDDARVASWRERTALRLDLGDILRRLGQLDEAESSYEEARSRIFRTERRVRESFDPAEVMRWDARVDFRLALTSKVRGDNARARELVERAIESAVEGGAVAETPAMWALLAALHRRERDLDACRAAVLRGLRVARSVASARRGAAPAAPGRRDDRPRQAISDLLISLGAVFYSRGQLVRAERCYRQAARAVDRERNPQTARFALNDLAVTMCLRGQNERARGVFAEVLALSERVGDLYDVAVAHNNLAELELRLAAPERALEHARRSVALGEQVHADADLPDCYRNLAQASFALGDLDTALDAATKGLALAERGGGVVYLGDVAVGMARIATAVRVDPHATEATRQRADAAIARLHASLDAHFGAPGLAARADEIRALLAAR